VSMKLRFLSLPAGLGLVVLALLALGPATRAEITPDAGGERHAAREGIDDTAALYPLNAAPLDSSPIWTTTGENDDDVLGWSDGGTCIASAGDVNGDGYADLVVGAPYHDADGVNKGKVYVYHGSPSGPSAMPGFTATGHTDWDQLGHGVAGVGDVNGDGYADILVGAPGVDAGGNAKGQAFLYLGGSGGLSSSPAFTITGQADYDALGLSVGGAGDVNGDGYADVLVGAPLAREGGDSRGQAYLYMGDSAGLSSSPAFTATGRADGDQLGAPVTNAGDVNGDGYADVLIGASGVDAGGSDRGQAYLYPGGSSGLGLSPAFTITGQADWEYLGISVAGAGDVNGDGYDDVLIGSPTVDVSGSNRGQAYLYLGGSGGLSPSPAFTVTGQADYDGLGFSVGGAGDVDGDGYADVLVGAPGVDAGGSVRGQAYLYLGGSSGLSPSPAFTITGQSDDDNLGISVAAAGDVNGDGYADILIDAPGAPGGTNKGQVYLYLGGSVESIYLPIIIKGP
jgi:hypothetical protein